MNFRLVLKLLFCISLLFSSTTFAEGWCNYSAGEFEVVTNGTKSDNVYLAGNFTGKTTKKWIYIANTTAGKNNLSLALAAQMTGKGLSVFIDSVEYDCDSFPSWSTSSIRHVKISM